MADTDEPNTDDSDDVAERAIAAMLDGLRNSGACPICIGRAMAMRGMAMCQQWAGSASAIEFAKDLIEAMREDDVAAPAHGHMH